MTHMRRSRMMMIPFIIMFIWGVFLIMRPRQQVQVTKVVETFTKRVLDHFPSPMIHSQVSKIQYFYKDYLESLT